MTRGYIPSNPIETTIKPQFSYGFSIVCCVLGYDVMLGLPLCRDHARAAPALRRAGRQCACCTGERGWWFRDFGKFSGPTRCFPIYPLVILHSHGSHGKWPMYGRVKPFKTSIYTGLSIAMLNNQMVDCTKENFVLSDFYVYTSMYRTRRWRKFQR